MKTLTFILVMLTSTTVLAKQKYYKWTDENGNIHYSAEKPEDRKTDEIKVSTNQPKISQSTSAAPETDIVDEVASEEDPEKSYIEQRREKKQQAKELAQKNQAQCQKAKQTINKYQQKVRMSRTDKETGEKVFLEDSKRAEIINNAKKAMHEFC